MALKAAEILAFLARVTGYTFPGGDTRQQPARDSDDSREDARFGHPQHKPQLAASRKMVLREQRRL
jgi:hypothetical protein